MFQQNQRIELARQPLIHNHDHTINRKTTTQILFLCIMGLHTKCFMFKIVNITVIIIIEKEIILSLESFGKCENSLYCYDATKTNEMFVHPCK